jgi:hypothetical protein
LLPQTAEVAAIVVSAKMPRFCVFVTLKTLLLTAVCSFIVLGDRGTSETMDTCSSIWLQRLPSAHLAGQVYQQETPLSLMVGHPQTAISLRTEKSRMGHTHA